MYIEKLEIRGFGKINDLSLKLNKGIHLFYGNNESGKSTLQTFIKSMFFGLKGGRTGKDGELPSIKKFRPWSCQDYGGYMEYRLESGDLFRVGRNFEENTVSVFDSLYNDITNGFIAGKDKGIQFAEAQLGINEACFERTVFVKQMDTRITNGSRELLHRLSNVYRSGMEDVSFKKAEDALKKALIQHVGTDRTTTRPLDKITSRIRELENRRSGLMDKRTQVFGLEDQLKALSIQREELENDKQLLEILREGVQIQEDIDKKHKRMREFERAFESLQELEQHRTDITEQIRKLEAEKEELIAFHIFEEEDMDEIKSNFNNLKSLCEQKYRLKNEIVEKDAQLGSFNSLSAEYKAFIALPCDIDEQIKVLSSEIKGLEEKDDKRTVKGLEEKISAARVTTRRIKYGVIASAVVSVVLLALGVTGSTFAYGICIGVSSITAALIYMAIVRGREIEEVTREKKRVLIESQSLEYLLDEKRERVNQIYASLGAENYEDFLKCKVFYATKAETMMTINNQRSQLENEMRLIERRISIINSSILEQLFTAGIIEGHSTHNIQEEHIRAFSYGVNRYKSNAMELRYRVEKYEDIKENMRKLLCGVECQNLEAVGLKIQEIRAQMDNETAMLKEILQRADTLFPMDVRKESHWPESLHAAKQDGDTQEMRTLNRDKLEMDYTRVCMEVNEIMLKCRENETLLKSLEVEDDILQRIEEEIFQLQNLKDQLEDKGIALKMALDIMQEASQEIQRDYAPALNSKMSQIIGKITGCRYENIKVDSNLILKAVAPETRDIVGVSSLSGGTMDQMYLAMRIAMAEVMTSTSEKLPLLLDEVFSQYDDERTRETLQYLMELSQERQVILFTCKKREVEIAESICREGLSLIVL